MSQDSIKKIAEDAKTRFEQMSKSESQAQITQKENDTKITGYWRNVAQELQSGVEIFNQTIGKEVARIQQDGPTLDLAQNAQLDIVVSQTPMRTRKVTLGFDPRRPQITLTDHNSGTGQTLIRLQLTGSSVIGKAQNPETSYTPEQLAEKIFTLLSN